MCLFFVGLNCTVGRFLGISRLMDLFEFVCLCGMTVCGFCKLLLFDVWFQLAGYALTVSYVVGQYGGLSGFLVGLLQARTL